MTVSVTPQSISKPVSSVAAPGRRAQIPAVSIFTGGGDSHYAIPLVCSLAPHATRIDVIGSDEYLTDVLLAHRNVLLHNVYTTNRPGTPILRKVWRLLATYVRLARYAARTNTRVFHILWLNRVVIDRVLVVTYFKLLRKKLLFTAHNVDIGERDGRRSRVGRWTLRFMYRWMDHVFVHTKKMKVQLVNEFGVDASRITVIPFGLNTVVPESTLTREEARRRLEIAADERIALFFGNIAPYKGVEFLLRALAILKQERRCDLRVIVAGRVKERRSAEYYEKLSKLIDELDIGSSVIGRTEFIPDAEVEVYFKAADVCVLPYTNVFQSGVLCLSYGFGCPVVATDVGSVREDVIEGRTGFVCRQEDPGDLANALRRYFDSELFHESGKTRAYIRDFARQKYSWTTIADATSNVHERAARD
jgi:glycosyltransferase involved in cell wall biosynthesis